MEVNAWQLQNILLFTLAVWLKDTDDDIDSWSMSVSSPYERYITARTDS